MMSNEFCNYGRKFFILIVLREYTVCLLKTRSIKVQQQYFKTLGVSLRLQEGDFPIAALEIALALIICMCFYSHQTHPR